MNEADVSPVERIMAKLEADHSELLLCRCCNAAITRCAERVYIGVSHNYKFTNPSGISYHISCYTNAPGCSIVGEATADDSWFYSYQWQLALCSECQEHLGWYYQHARDRFFFGLITERLVLADSR